MFVTVASPFPSRPYVTHAVTYAPCPLWPAHCQGMKTAVMSLVILRM